MPMTKSTSCGSEYSLVNHALSAMVRVPATVAAMQSSQRRSPRIGLWGVASDGDDKMGFRATNDSDDRVGPAVLGTDWNWRREWDSNPRWYRYHAGFQDRCLKPLGHLSVILSRNPTSA
jgi:hypothetical protein